MAFKKIACVAALMTAAAPQVAHAQATEPYIGEVIIVPYTFCPRFYIEAAGQLLPISQNTALFSLIGTFYGGNGQTTFALPDLRGRAIVHQGQGPGLSQRTMGQQSGTTAVALTTSQMPAHTHAGAMRAFAETGETNDPANNVVGKAWQPYYTASGSNVDMAAGNITVEPAGSGQQIVKTSPSLAMRYCIATSGVFPMRP